MSLLFSNNAASTLQGALVAGATTVVVAAGDAASFPQPSAAADYFMIVLEDLTQAPPVREIMKCTARVGANLTVVRAQEGTADVAFNAGVTVAHRITAGSLLTLGQTAGLITQLYLGAFATAPTETNTGGSLVAGLLYFNTTTNAMYEYSGAAWEPLTSGSGSTSGVYCGAFSVAPTTRPDGSALQSGDLYYNTTTGLYEYVNGAWAPAVISTNVVGNQTVDGDLTVDGNLTVIKNTTLDGTLSVTGDTTISGTLAGQAAAFTSVGGTVAAFGTLLLGGEPVVEAGDLSGTVYTQKWPNGNIEYWGTASITNEGKVLFPTAFPHALTYVDCQPLGEGAPSLILVDMTQSDATGFYVRCFQPNGTTMTDVSFFYCAKGN